MFSVLEERVVPELDLERLVGLISPFADRILFGNPLHQIRLEDEGPPSLWRINSAAHGVNCLRENCQSKFLAIGSDLLAICDPQKDVVIRSLHDHNGQVHDVAWHGSQPFVLSSVGDDSTLRMWDVRSHPAQVSMRRLQRPSYNLKYSPDSNLVACGGEDCIVIYDLCSNRTAVQIAQVQVTNLRFNPAECLLATSYRDHTCRFYDIDTGECVTQSIVAEGQVDRIEFHPQGQYLIVAGSNSTQTITWEPFSVLSQHLYRHHVKRAPPSEQHTRSGLINGGDGASVTVLDMAVLDGKLLQLVVERRTTSSHQLPMFKLLSSPLKELEMLVAPMTDRDADACEDAIALSMFGKFKLDSKESESSQTAILSPPLPTPQDNVNTAPPYPTPSKKKVNSRRAPPPFPSLPPSGVPTVPGGKLRRRSSTDALESSGSTSTSTRSSSSSRTGRERDFGGNSSGSKTGNASKPARIKPRSQTVVPSIASKCDEVVKSGTRVRETLRKRKEELSALLHRSRFPGCGVEVIIGAGAVVGESHVLSSLLREYLSFGNRTYTIDLNSQFLEHLRPLFNHPNNSYVQLALDFLVVVVDSCGDTIRHGLLAKDYCIGVDVAAESRYDRCLKCRNGLMQIRLNSSFLTERMDKRQSQVFESVLAKIDEIINM